MRVRACLALMSAGTVGVSALDAQQPHAAPTDSAQLQGTWTMVSGNAGGMALSPDLVSSMRRVASGNEVTITMSGQLYFKALIVLNPAASPRTIDYHMTGGPTAGATQLGIYELKGDTVRFCFGAPNAPRPVDFTATSGNQRTLSTWVRARP